MDFVVSELLTAINLIEDFGDFVVGIIGGIEFLDTVVAQTATHLFKEVVALLESIDHIGELVDLHA